jgi:molybdopterin-guanine dinucleotide biosynthesis protein A
MGADKRALALEEGGPSMAERAARLLARVAGEVIVVADDPKPFVDMDVRVVGDPPGHAGEGPLAGVVAALGAARGERVLCVAADLPFLNEELLTLLAGIAAREPGADAVVPAGEDGALEPLCAVYARAALPRLAALLERGERALHRALRDPAAGLVLRLVPPAERAPADPSGRALENVNTPADLERARRMSREPAPRAIMDPGPTPWPS